MTIKPKDQHAGREAGRYENPIVSREFILNFLHTVAKPLSLTDIARECGVAEAQMIALERRVGAMVRDGQLLREEEGYVPAGATMGTVHQVVEQIMLEHKISDAWPKTIDKELKKLPEEPDCTNLGSRTDLRHLPFVTIDGEDAKDFDDAVYCEAIKTEGKKGGWKLYVAIADVSHYVKPDTALDQEAHVRGNSIYFPNRVIPMLPEKLSNGLCSLKPHVNRFCLVSEMVITADGQLSSYRFYEAVIFSAARLTYSKVALWLGGDETTADHKVLPYLKELYTLYKALLTQRNQRGALDIDTIETKVAFNPEGHVTHVFSIQRNDAHRLIEECMLVANVAAAQFLTKAKAPAVYRIHDKPDPGKVTDLRSFLSLRGMSLSGGVGPHTAAFNHVLLHAKTHVDSTVIQTMVLRTMQQAIYSPQNIGHFGLAYETYTHFTSPIRRYSDLLVHRQLKAAINHSESIYTLKALEATCLHISQTERAADQASRDATQALKCLYLSHHLGSEFEVVVSGVTAFGIFATIQSWMIDGLIHVRTLRDDYYHFDVQSQTLTGERTGRVFQLGQVLKVLVAKADVDARRIDFELMENTKDNKPIRYKKSTTPKGEKRKRQRKKREK
jgi:ribonuclease R